MKKIVFLLLILAIAISTIGFTPVLAKEENSEPSGIVISSAPSGESYQLPLWFRIFRARLLTHIRYLLCLRTPNNPECWWR